MKKIIDISPVKIKKENLEISSFLHKNFKNKNFDEFLKKYKGKIYNVFNLNLNIKKNY